MMIIYPFSCSWLSDTLWIVTLQALWSITASLIPSVACRCWPLLCPVSVLCCPFFFFHWLLRGWLKFPMNWLAWCSQSMIVSDMILASSDVFGLTSDTSWPSTIFCYSLFCSITISPPANILQLQSQHEWLKALISMMRVMMCFLEIYKISLPISFSFSHVVTLDPRMMSRVNFVGQLFTA